MQHDEKWQQENLPKYIDHNAHMQVAASDFAEAYHEHMMRLRPADEWHEDMGDVLWFHLPIQESPYVGSPNDSDWNEIWPFGESAPTWYTHFQLITVKE